MKRTFNESWFIMCQPNSKVMDALMSDEVLYNPNRQSFVPSDNDLEWFNRAREVIVIQSEIQTNNHVMFEIMYKEDYEKYMHKDLKYIENLEKRLDEVKQSYLRAVDENGLLRDSLNDANKNNDKLYNENQKLEEAIRVLNNNVEILYDGHHYKLSLMTKDMPTNLIFEEYQDLEKAGFVARDISNENFDMDKEFVLDE